MLVCSPRPGEEVPGKHGNTTTVAGEATIVLNFEISKTLKVREPLQEKLSGRESFYFIARAWVAGRQKTVSKGVVVTTP